MTAGTATGDVDGAAVMGASAPALPDDPDLVGAVRANLHLARTAALACASQLDGLRCLAALDRAPMVCVGAVARSTIEAAGQLWWLRAPLTSGAGDGDVWTELAKRAAVVAGFWHVWSARLTEKVLEAPVARPLATDLAEELRTGAARSREFAATVRAEVGDLTFDYGRAARELMLAAGVRLATSVYARLCEMSHANPLGITRSDPRPDLLATGLMPWQATPSPDALHDDHSIDTFLLVVARSVSHAMLDGFHPATGRTWGLPAHEWAALTAASDDWVARVRPPAT